MSKLFSQQWSQDLASLWNKDKQMLGDLTAISFSGTIGFGILEETIPRITFGVEDGRVETVSLHEGDELDWDLRASEEDWKLWLREGFGLDKLAVASAGGRLKFLAGDYRRMIRTQEMSRPFLRVLQLMAKVKTD